MYVPLWCKTHYSFLEGASHPEELVETAHRLGLPALAVTDRDGVYGLVKAHVKAKELGVKLLCGAQITVDGGSRILLLAMSRGGYANLCALITAGRLRSPKGESRVTWQEVCAHAGDVIALWGGAGSLLAGASGKPTALVAAAEPDAIAAPLRAAFGDRLYALLVRHREDGERLGELRLRERARRHGLPLVAGCEVLYHSPARRPLQDVLTCIRHKVTLHTAGRLTRPNGLHALHAEDGFARLFADVPDAVARTLEVAGRCTFSMDELRYRYPSERLPGGMTSQDRLRQLTLEGAQGRYPREVFPEGVPPAVRAQIERELRVIGQLDYPGYFLTMYEIVRFCREREILCQGRGSAANSIVCYCLGITAIDPVRMNLLFERFISLERAEPPDIDLDIQHNRREEVILWVYEKYGRSHAAMVANIIRYRPKSAIRDVGKALGLPETVVTRLAKVMDAHGGIDPETFSKAGLEGGLPVYRHLLRLAEEVLDFPRHLSIHPGGFLLGQDPVATLVPIENATMPGRTVIQWDKDDAEALGLFKIDLLALGALTHLDLSFRMLAAQGIALPDGRPINLATIPADDPATYDLMCRGDTIGVFQIESRAQMAMLPRLRPRKFYDLVVEISIVRPGPIVGGMVHPYLRRRRGTEPVTYPHPLLEPVLEKTLGVPLFQEQVMKLAMVAADYTPGEADQLRRDMAAWRRSGRIALHRERLVTRMVAKGIPAEFAERVYEQIRGFGEYGFPESHAASFALIAYASAWLRCHYPPAFFCGLLNAWPMGFYHPATLVEDARRRGVEMRPIRAADSQWLCTLEAPRQSRQVAAEHPFAVRMGLRYVKGLREADGQRIVDARGLTPAPKAPAARPSPKERGERPTATAPFRDVDDFKARTRLNQGALLALAAAGALDGLGVNRRTALWAVREATTLLSSPPAPLLSPQTARGKERGELLHPGGGFPSPRSGEGPPRSGAGEERQPALPWSSAEAHPTFAGLDAPDAIGWDRRHSSHSVRGHPLAPLRKALRAQGLPDAATLNRLPHGKRTRFAGLVINRQHPSSANNVTFMTLEDETGWVNLVVWEQVFRDHAVLARTANPLGVTGKVQMQDGVVHLVVERFWLPELPHDAAPLPSRDFR